MVVDDIEVVYNKLKPNLVEAMKNDDRLSIIKLKPKPRQSHSHKIDLPSKTQPKPTSTVA